MFVCISKLVKRWGVYHLIKYLSPALIVPSPALILTLPVKRFPDELAPKMSNNISKNPPFCYFASFLIVSLTPFTNNPDSSRDLTAFIILLIYSKLLML